MSRQPLTLIVPIRSGQEQALRQVLAAIADDLHQNPFLPIARSTRTHFLRLAIMNDQEFGSRLLLTCNFDGDLSSYLQEWLSLGDDLDQLWDKCEGYEGSSQLESFVRRYSYYAQAAYIALQGETVLRIRRRQHIRQWIQQVADLKSWPGHGSLTHSADLLDELFSLKDPLSLRKAFQACAVGLWQAVQRIPAGICMLLKQLILRIFRFLGSILGAPERKRLTSEVNGVKVDFERLRILQQPEVVNGTNHLHLLSTIRKGRLCRLRIVLFLINFAGRYLFPPGSLSNINSIHFAHWSIVDNGRHLLFVTHYNDSFDNYLGDFADRASDGLNSIWNNVEGYPEAGAVDIVAFKQFFRNDQQLPSQVFYRAYPELSVGNILRDRSIVQPLANSLNQSKTRRWLSRL